MKIYIFIIFTFFIGLYCFGDDLTDDPILSSNLILLNKKLGVSVGDVFYSNETSKELKVSQPMISGTEHFIFITSNYTNELLMMRVYLDFNKSRNESFIKRISITDEDGTKEFETAMDIFTGFLIILQKLNRLEVLLHSLSEMEFW
jgi:hypothetical protein